MNKFYSTYTTTFLFISIVVMAFFLAEADFLAIPVTEHPLEVGWTTYTGFAYLPCLIIFLFPALVVLFSCGVGLVACRMNRFLPLTLKTLGIITGTISFGVVINYISSKSLSEESLPFLYWTLIGLASCMSGLLITCWINHYSYVKKRRIEEPGFRPNQRFPYALFRISLGFAVLWLMVGIISTPITVEYDMVVIFCSIVYILYSVIIWSLALFIHIRDKFVNARILRRLFTCLIILPGAGITLLIGIFILIVFINSDPEDYDYRKPIEEYKREKEELERKENEAREAEYLAYRAEYLAGIEAARGSVLLVDEDYQPDIRAFSFDFLWTNPEADIDSVTSAISYALGLPDYHLTYKLAYKTVDDYRQEDTIIYKHKGESSFERLHRYLMWIFPVENIASIACNYLDYLPALLPEEDFRDSSFEQKLIHYMVAYQELYNSQEHFEAFRLVYEVVSRPLEREDQYSGYETNALYYDKFAPCLHLINEYDPADEWEKSKLTIKYSFWARRYNEGTHRDLYYMMKSIWKLYN
ncbi:MAG: hypothetical protein LUG98_13955 [Tannerellaceae bacterium]|nr:hypothetical protein [Tannerellaceae bacterium]